MSEFSRDSVIERTRTQLAIDRRPAVKINFHMQPQCHSNWCWAAVAVSVSAYYDATRTVTQCELASLELRKDCCAYRCGDTNVPGDVNVMSTLGSALNRVRCLKEERPGQIMRQEIIRELHAARPVCARLVWSRVYNIGGGHFVAISGYDRWTDTLLIEDPVYGPSEIGFERFRSDYQVGGGEWKKTYLTENGKPR